MSDTGVSTKITKLKMYIDLCTQSIQSANSSEKREFFEREVRKAKLQIEKLTK